MNLGGVIGVNTSVSTPGSITISTVDEGDIRDGGGASSLTSPTIQADRRAGALVLSGLIANLPEENGQTVPSDGGSFTPGSVNLTGGSVWLQNGSLIEAPGASVGLTALTPSLGFAAPAPGSTLVQGRVYLDDNATVDVAGLSDVTLPMSDILVTVGAGTGMTANDLANSPLLRNGFLLGKSVIIDSTLSGTSADGLAWVGSPILNASGYVGLIPRSIDQVLTNGGAITLSGGQVMSAAGSLLNLDGGFVHYLGGTIATTRLLDASGNVVDIANASPQNTYVGIAGQFTAITGGHWGVTQDFMAPLLSGAYYAAGYIQGGNAGTLSVFGAQATVLDGAMTAQAFAGFKQIEAGRAASGTAAGGNFLPEGGSFILGAAHAPTEGAGDSLTGAVGSVIIQDYAPQLTNLAPGFSATTPLDNNALNALGPNDPNNILAWTTVPATPLSNGGFANVTVTEDRGLGRGIVVAQGTTLAVQPGGSISLSSSLPITVLGDLNAVSGTISISSGFSNIVVGPDAVISAAGAWVNDNGQFITAGAATYVNGGSISLSTGDADQSSIILNTGSVLDVSSGGVLLTDGELQMSNGVPIGKGGNISLITYSSNGKPFGDSVDGGSTLPNTQPTAGRIVMDGTIDGFGFSGGGTLTLQALGFQIGGDPAAAPIWDLYLPANFFANQGFGAYQLNAMYDVTVAPNASRDRYHAEWLDHARHHKCLRPAGHQPGHDCGGDLFWRTPSGALPQYDGVTNAVTIGEGASILADARASIGLGSPAQVTVLGSIVAPGGSITLSAESGISIDGFAQPGQAVVNYATNSKSVWLGPDAVLDVSGLALINPFVSPVRIGGALALPTTGEVIDGGSVVLATDAGSVVTQAGSVIDVSGTSAIFDQPQQSSAGLLGGQNDAPQLVWSDAGSITLAAAGTLKAQAGAPLGQGGTLTILPAGQVSSTVSLPTANAIILQQASDSLPTGLIPGQSPLATSNNTLVFSLDELKDSGISTLVVGNANSPYGDVPVGFAGSVNLSLDNAVVLNTSQLVALAAGTTTFPTVNAGTNYTGAPSVSIAAPYVAIAGPNGTGTVANNPQPITTAALGDATLAVNARFIDLGNQVSLENFGQATFVSRGDLRLSSTNSNGASTLQPGLLYTPGNLTFQAADLYPASGERFILDAANPNNPTTISFLGNGSSQVPLSAGGSLLVDATNIVQAGTLRAPAGTLQLGVGDTSLSATQTAFANLPLVDTQSVTLAAGSTTSVSLDGTSLPYGTTTDSLNWQYNAVAADTTPADLSAPPAKVIALNGAHVALNSGATVDLSGGGDLYATEWVPGTGGTRNLLAQYNVTYPASGAAVATPLYPDARNIYAIVPSYEAPVAAYDPVYAQVTEPAANANGTATTQTEATGVGQATLNGQVGQAVYLSGVPGLAAGTYVLLPAKYATLPGAYRVVENTGATNVVPGQSITLPDGTHIVSGYYVDALSGAQSATPVQFSVQSAAVWEQYSQYTLTSANAYFASQAASKGTAVPPLPADAGQLALAAAQTLILDATLKTAAGPGGVAAAVDIAAQDIEIVGQGEQGLAGYLQLSAASLDQLGAGSLLIGGTRTATASGLSINAIANSVVVANDANNPLTGPEILLVTKTDPAGSDPNSKNGLMVESGSVIEARGSRASSASSSITIGQNANGATPALSGDGALLRVSNAGQVTITRNALPANAIGALTVQAGATLDGGAALTLDSSGSLSFDPAARFTATNIAVDAPAITLTHATGAGLAGLSGFVVGPQNLGQFASANQVDLRSYGSILFDGTVDLAFGQSVELSAGTFIGTGGSVTIAAPSVAFTNDLGATQGTPTAGTASLNVNANQIDLGAGSKALAGFDSVTMTATGGLVGQNSGSFNMGSAHVALAAPVYLADTSSQTSLTTTGALVLNSNQGTPLALNPVGGAISFIGGTLAVNGAAIAAPAGNVSLEATAGDLSLAAGSSVSSQGVAKSFFDVIEYAPAGTITLTADHGAIVTAAGSTLDFAGASGGGAAGTLNLSAPAASVTLSATILGNAAAGSQGGSFALKTGGSADLDNLAAELAQSGVTQSIDVVTGAGNLILSAGNTITARNVSLTANGGSGGLNPNDGNIVIDGTINAAGPAGGTIALYGKSGVDLEGALIATGSSTTEQGGSVNIGTSGIADGTYNATYGYENVSSAQDGQQNYLYSGTITLGANALIDVSGGTKGGLSGGSVNFRAPLLDNGDVNVTVTPGARILGSRATTLEAYAVWSTTDQTQGAQHFDGIVDPAGWYTSTGTLVSGSFANASGTVVASWDGSTLTNDDGTSNTLSYYLTNTYFTPAAGAADAAHQAFYAYQSDGTTPGTLMGFIENLPIASSVASRFANAGVENFAVAPGVELDNPDPNINNGNIAILTNWNLGAGSTDANGHITLAYRYQGEAPIITFKAKNDVKVDASLSDGFFQIENPTGSVATIQVPAGSDLATATADLNTKVADGNYTFSYYANLGNYGVTAPATFSASADAGEVAQYYGQYNAYMQYLMEPVSQINGTRTAHPTVFNTAISFRNSQPVAGQPTVSLTAPTAAQEAADPTAYLRYLNAYQQAFTALVNFEVKTGQTGHLAMLLPPPAALGPVIPTATITAGNVAVDNSPSPVAVAGNSLPLLAASLISGTSSTFRLVAGADMTSTDPLALQPAAPNPSGGSVSLDGHFAWIDTVGQKIYAPTMIRTGTGSIEIAAADNVNLLDQTAPGVIYTAGTPAGGAPVGSAGGI
ncbi:hypothetical protein GW17_00056881, partial [Ensete ventricosum]